MKRTSADQLTHTFRGRLQRRRAVSARGRAKAGEELAKLGKPHLPHRVGIDRRRLRLERLGRVDQFEDVGVASHSSHPI